MIAGCSAQSRDQCRSHHASQHPSKVCYKHAHSHWNDWMIPSCPLSITSSCRPAPESGPTAPSSCRLRHHPASIAGSDTPQVAVPPLPQPCQPSSLLHTAGALLLKSSNQVLQGGRWRAEVTMPVPGRAVLPGDSESGRA
jgi:hypothetical protein